MNKSALITGINGQDGSYLAESLLALGYEVHGTTRHRSESLAVGATARGESASVRTQFLQGVLQRLHLHQLDLCDHAAIERLVRDVHPDEVYNLAAPSVVGRSWDDPLATTMAAGLGVVCLLESIRRLDTSIRFFQASSSEMFGRAAASPQSESTPFQPTTPYAAAKVLAHTSTVQFRRQYGLFACCGILFNHESPRRAPHFVTRKITQAVAAIARDKRIKLRLGNLEAQRDWGFAGDYVEAMRRMLQCDEPADCVIGTGRAHRVRDFAEEAFRHAGLDWKDHVVVDPELCRAIDPELVVADPSRARANLQWEPAVSFEGLVEMMVDHDFAAAGLIGEAVSSRGAVAALEQNAQATINQGNHPSTTEANRCSPGRPRRQ